ncbi:MAG: esterase [Lachnospiraceae bacterium]|nr:esterase [Lachnospiraceae bacterium]
MEIFEYGSKASKSVLIQMVDDHDTKMLEREARLISEMSGRDFYLKAFKVKSWNKDLSPWKASAVFGNEDFGEGAKDTLTEILSTCIDDSKTYYIGGYSLAGLFALWSSYQTDVFKGVAAASPSVWFRGFADFMKEHEIKSSHVYLSLGDKEAKTRNAVMSTVDKRIQEAYAHLKEKGVNCAFEWNKGNHFTEAELRTAKAFSWVLKQGSR